MQNPSPQLDQKELETLVVSAHYGDSEAFSQLYECLYSKVQAYVYRRTFDENATQDIVANSFYHILTHISSFRWQDEARFYAWVFRIVMNEIASYYRQGKKYNLREDWLEFSDEVRDERESVEKIADTNQRIAALKRCLARLPKSLRDPVELYYFAQLPHETIARTLGISTGATRVRVHRGIQELEKFMKGEGYEY